MSYDLIAIFMFASMMLMLMTGQRVFGAIGAVAAASALALWGTGGSDIPFSCLLYTSPSPRDRTRSRMPSSA